MNQLPFLKKKGWPRTELKEPSVSRYGYSDDDDLIDHALDELTSAVDAKDHKLLIKSFKALIDVMKSKENKRNK